MDALSVAWRWRSSDTIIHTLPLHHIHGLVNALLCAHYNAATVDFMPFRGPSVWTKLCEGDASVLMGVPSMYAHLLQVYNKFDGARQAECAAAAAALRLAVCGSAACPLTVMQGWKDIAGEVRAPKEKREQKMRPGVSLDLCSAAVRGCSPGLRMSQSHRARNVIGTAHLCARQCSARYGQGKVLLS
jgi:acyl-CoA synthetase (AMP-forming)/AMP-acid ligase II